MIREAVFEFVKTERTVEQRGQGQNRFSKEV